MLKAFAEYWPFPVSADAELRRSLAILGVTSDPGRVLEAGYTVSTLVTIATGLVIVAFVGFVPAVILSSILGLGLASAIRTAPPTLAAFRRTRALGDSVELVGTLALQMRLAPVPERTARFAARSGHGLLAESLDDWVARSRGTPKTGLTGFANEWSEWFPALERATAGVLAAAEAEPERRGRTLDRAVNTVDAALHESVASFAGELHGPVTGLYAFGVLLPLALVGTLPAAIAAGIPITPTVFVLLYDVLLPLSVAVAGVKLLAKRPVAFPPPAVTVETEGTLDRRLLAVIVGTGTTGIGWILGAVTVGKWAAPIVAVGGGVGIALIVTAQPVVHERRRVREMERGLSDALSAVGRAVADGEAVETAVVRASETTPGPAGEAFAQAARRRKLLGLTVRRSFLGDHGPFADRGGTRSRGTVALLSRAAREGKPAGEALLSHADRLDELLEHEREGRRALATVTRTLAHTGGLFGPLVGGATVALAGRLAEAEVGLGAEGARLPLSTDLVGIAVGCYVLLLAVILTALATGLERGLDGSLLAYRVGISVLLAAGTFITGVVGAGLLL